MILKTFNQQSAANTQTKARHWSRNCYNLPAISSQPRPEARHWSRNYYDSSAISSQPRPEARHWSRNYYDLPAISSQPRPINHAYICAASPRATTCTHNAAMHATTHTRRAPPGRNPFRGCFYRATARTRIRVHMTARTYCALGTVTRQAWLTDAVTPPFR